VVFLGNEKEGRHTNRQANSKMKEGKVNAVEKRRSRGEGTLTYDRLSTGGLAILLTPDSVGLGRSLGR